MDELQTMAFVFEMLDGENLVYVKDMREREAFDMASMLKEALVERMIPVEIGGDIIQPEDFKEMYVGRYQDVLLAIGRSKIGDN